ncbi:ATP-grasp domain-containing protein [Kocuria sp.]|uniref:ATP-grasp domain-containing protein n=1 Tax=Kocuria sp. TaxID=1871328 RepID=UPI0026E00413|nr:ATP-grasp domain-containing protein [Kocuria sp.]MDO5618532.1 ATP-grasp domain-containing protein [Kocuria sp.]
MVESPVTGAGADAARFLDHLGFRTLLLAHNPDAMPEYLRDQLDKHDVRVVRTDTQSVAAMRATICTEVDGEPAAVLSFYEYYAAQAAELADELGLPGPNPEAVRVCRNKADQRDTLRCTNLSLRYARCGTPEEAAQTARDMGRPVVVKPTNLTGSVLVRRCETPEEAAEAAAAVLHQESYLGVPVTPEVVVEEFIEGREYSVELMHGQAVAVTGKELAAGTVIEIAHTVPAPIHDGIHAALASAAEATCKMIGLGWGPAHVEVRREDSGRIVVIEVNARVAGDRIPELVRLVTGRDLVQEQICAALGREVDRAPCCGARTAMICFRQGPGGRLDRVGGEDRAHAVPGVREVHVRIAQGQEHRLNDSNQDRVAWCIATGEDATEARLRAQEALGLLDLSWTAAEGDGQ